jgi:hypothetical protein
LSAPPSDQGTDVRVDVRDLLNSQTGRIGWDELQRHFARGVVLVAAPGLDLIDVAARLVEDNAASVQAWTDTGALQRADLDRARDWEARRPEFWAVVVAPWVVVQESD